jgi:hypothetical protein
MQVDEKARRLQVLSENTAKLNEKVKKLQESVKQIMDHSILAGDPYSSFGACGEWVLSRGSGIRSRRIATLLRLNNGTHSV